MNRFVLPVFAFALLLQLAPQAARADDDVLTIPVTIQDHKFTPDEIHVPANTRYNLVVTNQDKTTEEFDSEALQVEKVVTGGGKVTIHLHPLEPGKYPFMGEYHSDTAKGAVVVP